MILKTRNLVNQTWADLLRPGRRWPLFAVLTSGMALGLAGCGSTTAEIDPYAGKMMYFDTASKQPVVANILRETPAVHPETGERTLVPALYCDACRAWQPAPPLEVAQRTPASRRCPHCGGPLNSTGPWP